MYHWVHFRLVIIQDNSSGFGNMLILKTPPHYSQTRKTVHYTMNCMPHSCTQGLYSLSGKTSYRKISWSLEATRFGFKLFQSLWNLAGTSAALLPRCLSNFRAIRPLQHPISRLRDFTRFGGKTSYRLVNRGPVWAATRHQQSGVHFMKKLANRENEWRQILCIVLH